MTTLDWRDMCARMRSNDVHNLPLYMGLTDEEIDAIDLAGSEFDDEMNLLAGAWTECS